MSILDEMNSPELEALAAKLYAQIDRSPNRSEMPQVELEDVKGWIALHRKESLFRAFVFPKPGLKPEASPLVAPWTFLRFDFPPTLFCRPGYVAAFG